MSQQTLDRIDEKIRECGYRDAANALESVLKRINRLLTEHYRPPISDDDSRDDEVEVKFPLELRDPVRIHNPDGCLFLVERIEDGTFYIIDVETTGGWDAPPDVDGFFYKPLELTRMRTFWAHGKGYREIVGGTTQTLMCLRCVPASLREEFHLVKADHREKLATLHKLLEWRGRVECSVRLEKKFMEPPVDV